jgi:hypothetical protein
MRNADRLPRAVVKAGLRGIGRIAEFESPARVEVLRFAEIVVGGVNLGCDEKAEERNEMKDSKSGFHG